MKPLLSGPVVTKLGEKLRDALGLYGNRFSNVDEAGDTVQGAGSVGCQWLRPANCALRGLMVPLRALQASIMLEPVFPIEISDGIWSKAGFVSTVRRPS